MAGWGIDGAVVVTEARRRQNIKYRENQTGQHIAADESRFFNGSVFRSSAMTTCCAAVPADDGEAAGNNNWAAAAVGGRRRRRSEDEAADAEAGPATTTGD